TINHKASGRAKISDVAPLESSIYGTPGPVMFTWSDGDQDGLGTTMNGVYMNAGTAPTSFQWTVKATNARRTLRLYISSSAQTTVTAHLQGGSVPDAVLTGTDAACDIQFRAVAPDETLTVTWTYEPPVDERSLMNVWAATLF